MSKRTVLDPRNALTTLKAMIANVVAALVILAVPFAVAYWVINEKDMLILGRVIQGLALVAYLWGWGFIANKFWRWE